MEFKYGLDEKLPLIKSVLFGLQWAALLISFIIILGNVVGGIHFNDPLSQITYIQKILFVSGVLLFSQITWGHKLPVIPGPSAVLLVGVIASQSFGMSSIYTSIIIGGVLITILALGGLFSYLQKLFTGNVVVVVMLLITFTLLPTIQNMMIGEESGVEPFYNLCFAVIFIFLMFIGYRILRGIWQSTLIIWAMIAGSILYFIIFLSGNSTGPAMDTLLVGGFFEKMNFRFDIEPGVLISFIFCYMALSINDIGSMKSVNELVQVDDGEARIKRGLIFTGLGNILSGLLGVIGPVNYTLSPGMLASSRCASRFILFPTAMITLIIAFSPAVIAFIGSVPSVVIGVVLAYIMTSQVSATFIMAFKGSGEKGFQFGDGLVIGLSILLGTIVAFLPNHAVESIPTLLKPVMGNGFVVGVITALLLEHIILRRPK